MENSEKVKFISFVDAKIFSVFNDAQYCCEILPSSPMNPRISGFHYETLRQQMRSDNNICQSDFINPHFIET